MNKQDQELQSILQETIQKEKDHLKKKTSWIPAAVIASALGVVYLGGAWYFHNRYQPNTTINGQNVSYKTAMQIENKMESSLTEGSIVLQELNGEESVPIRSLGVKTVFAPSFENLLNQRSPFLWPSSFFTELLARKPIP